MKYFEDQEIGVLITFNSQYDVTEEEIIEIGNRFDSQPFHTDPVAAKESIFGGLVASSVHIFAMFVAISDRDGENKSAAVSALGFSNMQMRASVRAGDTLYSRYKVTNKRLSNSRPDMGIVEVSSEMFNQNDEVVFVASNAYLCKCRDAC